MHNFTKKEKKEKKKRKVVSDHVFKAKEFTT